MNLYAPASLYIGINICLILFLAFRVVIIRRGQKIGLGDGANHELQRRIRVHANAVENIPMAMLGLLLMCGTGQPVWLIHILGIVFTIARILHAYGLSKKSGTSFGRFYGTVITWITMGIICNILHYWRNFLRKSAYFR